jgi:hypothetical protein
MLWRVKDGVAFETGMSNVHVDRRVSIVVFIRMVILNKQTGEQRTIESRGGREVLTLLKFAAKVRKFANPKWKILRIETDSVTAYSYMREHKPDLPVDLVAEDG